MSEGFTPAMELLLGERPSLNDVQRAAALREAGVDPHVGESAPSL